ncbi:TadE/TadG family type IV pilus assembly protein [Chondromyces crocatus]|uniref:Pilus assembly protein TadE n=1 Tax=Chondromyces crocatus TaxID=52 RepID=A0A0K1E6Q0_CHOCO|nr:TadE family protein [Chondromyces crocatus]AKT36529.1 uncharacterized protein CMC5_006450 [Chondromyces crocatus]
MARWLRAPWQRSTHLASTHLTSTAPRPEATTSEKKPSLVEDRRGAVYVEFLGAFFPLFTMFLALVQFGFIQTASIIVQHSAIRASRTAAVILHDNPAHYGGALQGTVTAQKREMVLDDARGPLKSLGNANQTNVTFDKNNYGRDDMVRLRVQYPYGCKVPVGRTIACGFDGQRTLEAEASMPNQGADFIY